ncbi:HD-GYP domain-containing protein [Cohnella sp. LGH]|uniref:HD-GYP domain-containing protein (C-di-GMP phosphodiesterase class II) n=1 Tax=Cohnella phaseoli TaxID=456490 RepID=A0A3D9KAT5_9BACL|nr:MULTISPECIES: HD-GYP domain-containing protein [Cohnella]QTH42932.1 HD-GYP domain-containing protein [Cohnella sp. LGH]RED83393.1 HD-GYP domain-containing protein (c-di-GMP phosphodiesterase class II) [Cohnella phaseoli]
MPTIPITQIQLGDRLSSDVQTALGSVLLQEGRVLSERDMEILQAFLIPSIEVVRNGLEESAAEENPNEIAATAETKLTMLQQEFLLMEKQLQRTISMVSSGQKIPVLDLRNGLTALIGHMHDYNVLTFSVPLSLGDPNILIRNSILCAMTSYQLAKWNKFPEKDWLPIAMAGLLHDIGNVKVDPAIFNKPSGLTAEEIQEMRQHTVYGFKLLEGIASFNQGIWLAALQHHERIDGSGYPLKVKGEKIHPYAKIVAIADMYHAMTSNRKYRKAESPYLVLEELHAGSFGKLDPLYVQTFIERTTQFHNGVFVKLNDGRIGEIVFTDRQNPTRPMISINGQIVNLGLNRQWHIVEVFSTK